MKKNLSIMADLGMLPDVLGSDWSYVFLQVSCHLSCLLVNLP